jgi:acetyl-CoA carboxylase biotin carboxyl carrier protein
MVNPSNSGNDVFDIRRIKRLVELMQENDLTELDIQQPDMRIQLKRNASAISPPMVVPTPVPVPAVPVQSVSAPAPVPADDKNIYIIKSPMVGTFYTAPNPDVAPFVKVGDTISSDTTICLIEAMKVYNEIQAECSGKIAAVLAKNGETVEFGKPLFQLIIEN